MSFGMGLALVAVALVVIEIVDIFVLDLWTARAVAWLGRGRREEGASRYPWTDRTGT